MSIFINFEEDTDDFAYSKIERPPLPRNDQLDRSVDELELSVRSYNCLKNAGYPDAFAIWCNAANARCWPRRISARSR